MTDVELLIVNLFCR